jgi:DivIVA domain-containing protein
MANVGFSIVLRGYDRTTVDTAVARANEALASTDPEVHAAAGAELRGCQFRLALRGYDRSQVDAYVSQLAGQLG